MDSFPNKCASLSQIYKHFSDMATLKIIVEIGQNCSYIHKECFNVRIVTKMIKTLKKTFFSLCCCTV